MYSKSVLIALAATASADVILHPGHLAAKRDLFARQTSTDMSLPTGVGGPDTACLTGLMSLYSTLPTPPPELLSYEAANPPTDVCSYSVPPSLASQFTAYESQAISWASAHSAELSSALSQCPSFSSIGSQGGSFCTKGVAGSGSGSGSGSGTTSNGGPTVSKNAGPKETGMIAAAIAAAGFIGAVAAL